MKRGNKEIQKGKGQAKMEGKEKKLEGGRVGFMDTGTGRSVGIGLSVLWYRVIVQRKTLSGYFKTAS